MRSCGKLWRRSRDKFRTGIIKPGQRNRFCTTHVVLMVFQGTRLEDWLQD